MNSGFRKFHAWLPVAFFLSGAAALTHQVVWTRRLVDVLGASAATFSQVIGAFFVGLAAGSFWMARQSATGPRGVRWAGVAELLVGVLAIPALFANPIADALRGTLGSGFLKSGLVPLLVIPSAVMMGVVMPSALRVLGGSQRDALMARVYAANTFGGVAGMVATVFLLIPTLGLVGAGIAACLFNGMVGLALIWAGRHSRQPSDTQDRQVEGVDGIPARLADEVGGEAREAQTGSILLSMTGFLSGFLVLAAEVVLQHQFAQVTINSTFSSSLVLAIVLVGLGLGSWAAGRWLSGSNNAARTMAAVLGLAGLACGLEPWLFHGHVPGLRPLPYTLPAFEYFGRLVGLGLVAVLPVMLCSGCVFPLALKSAGSHRGIAVMLAWNGVGGWMGSELAERWIGPALGLWRSMAVFGALYGGLGLWWAVQWMPRTHATPLETATPGSVAKPSARGRFEHWGWAALWAGLACLMAMGSLRLGWRLPHVGTAPGEKLVGVAVGREGVVATVTAATNDWRILFNNTYTLGGSKAAMNQERQAHLPLLLHGRADSVGVLGIATGSTLAGVTLHREIQQITAAELSPLAYQMARGFFAEFNRNSLRDPRVQVVLEDARWLAADRRGAFDVVIGDLFLPWRTGEGRLFSLEHFEQVRRSLRPGGLYCQWLPLYQLTRAQFDCICRTFLEVFPRALVLRGDFYGDMPIVGLVGGRTLDQVDWAAVERATSSFGARRDVRDALVRHAEGVAMAVLGELPLPGPGPINTLGNNWLEWDAGRNILGMRTPWFIGVPCAEWMRAIHRQSNPRLPEHWREAHDAGQFFLTLDVAVLAESPLVENFRSQIPERMPRALWTDPNVDWQQWPSRVKPLH